MSVEFPREEAPYIVHRQLFGWVISHDPATLYAALDKPSLLELPYSVANFIYDSPKSLIPSLLRQDDKGQYVEQVENSLRTSLIDIVSIFAWPYSPVIRDYTMPYCRKVGTTSALLRTMQAYQLISSAPIFGFRIVVCKRVNLAFINSRLTHIHWYKFRKTK